LGQATHPPRDSSAERAPQTSESGPPPAATRETTESQARDRDDSTDDERSQTAEQQSTAHNGGETSGQEAAAAINGKQNSEHKPADGDTHKSTEAKVKRRSDKYGTLTNKIAHGSSPGDDVVQGAHQSAIEDVNQAALEQVGDAAVEKHQSGKGADGDTSGAGNGLLSDVETESASIGDPSANGATNVVVAASTNQAGERADGPAVEQNGAVEAIGSQQVESIGKVEPQKAGKRVRSAWADAIGDATSPAGQPLLGSPESTAIAAAAMEAAAAEFLSTKDAEKDSPATDAKSNENNDRIEPRAGAATATTAAREERIYGASDRSEGLTEAERVRFVQRVARAFHSMSDDGGEVRLRLSPPELGSLRVEVSVRDGVLSARLEAETSSARNLLLDNLPALRERLAEQNIKVERFEVDVRDERRQAPGEQFAGQPDVPRQGQRDRSRGHEIKRPGAIPLSAARGAIRGDNTGELNIVI
jgi:flagellar hook-length control protein FliK